MLIDDIEELIFLTVFNGKEDEFLDIINQHEVDFACIGVVTSALIYVDKEKWGVASTYQDVYDSALEKALNS